MCVCTYICDGGGERCVFMSLPSSIHLIFVTRILAVFLYETFSFLLSSLSSQTSSNKLIWYLTFCEQTELSNFIYGKVFLPHYFVLEGQSNMTSHKGSATMHLLTYHIFAFEVCLLFSTAMKISKCFQCCLLCFIGSTFTACKWYIFLTCSQNETNETWFQYSSAWNSVWLRSWNWIFIVSCMLIPIWVIHFFIKLCRHVVVMMFTFLWISVFGIYWEEKEPVEKILFLFRFLEKCIRI